MALITGMSAADANESVKVDRLVFSVQLSDGRAYALVGYLYYKGSYHNRPLQVAVHGLSYDHRYWDLPNINGRRYSYARYMAEQKYAVLALDQLCAGESDTPANGDFVVLSELSSALHQVITQLRTGQNGTGYRFESIAVVGHSLGSTVGVHELARHHDVDALVTTGLGHVAHPLPVPPEFIAFLAREPFFTFPPDVRQNLFYYLPNADPDMVSYDLAHFMAPGTRGELFTALLTVFAPDQTLVGAVTGDVLVQLGENDSLFPSAFASEEAAVWTSASHVTVQSLASVGHAVNSHLDHERSWIEIDAWLTAKFGGR